MSQDTDDLSKEVELMNLNESHVDGLKSISLKLICAGIQRILSPGLETISASSWASVESLLQSTAKNISSVHDTPSDIKDAAEYFSTITEWIRAWAKDLQQAISALHSPEEKQKLVSLQVVEKVEAAERSAKLASTISGSCQVLLANMGKRTEWEIQHPIEAAQEFELHEYSRSLSSSLLQSQGGKALNDIPGERWAEAEKQLRSLENYLKEHKIQAVRIRETKIDKVMVALLKAVERLDETGINRQKVDVAQAERIWGLVDKLGSGLSYLLQVDARRREGEAVPTTHSIFLLKSAPPANLKYSASPSDWIAKQLAKSAAYLDAVVIQGNIAVNDEKGWSVVFQELSALEDLLISGVTLTNAKESKIDETLKGVGEKIRGLEANRNGKDEGDLSLMYVSWELALRISAYFNELEA
ncbi:hypothetical protein VC83_06850 [Pseudogymnoascus destructans]|uniref:Uncharacterized protein n=2 Tax=Pseudogymnoascus destructans TaxID=655981 RepID=L8GBT8_PSED2|nr:uncharacterized protein VC83_06850 [Pseudogymnoascus destructans]ELR10670.1 hypothetical protein GMDG_04937 [Pseudogymnoascus destructans 20631-21]OAF56406.1 hypothetical protein VC83_06850 [Pseudogymnoascus destructans]